MPIQRGRGHGNHGGRGQARAANRTRCSKQVLGCNGFDVEHEVRGQTICILHAYENGLFNNQTEELIVEEAKEQGINLLDENGKPMLGQATSQRLSKTPEVRCVCAFVCGLLCVLSSDTVCLLH